jgi:myo-inositol-1(or 4)-monophosphatase
MSKDKAILEVAVEAAEKAGVYLRREFENFDRATAELKQAREIVTKADKASEKIILDTIKKYFPKHGILAEESGNNQIKSDFLWIIDPIDGTSNFAFKNPLFSVSIAVLVRGEVVAGVVYAPYMREMFVAELGRGAFLNGKAMRVSKNKDSKLIHTFCHGHSKSDIARALKYYRKQKLAAMDCRQLGSAALELAYTACGRVESIVIPGTRAWDVAAGVLLVKEAGGMITDFSGEAWNLKRMDLFSGTKGARDIVASNGLVHADIIGKLK